jgi:plastocyanin
MRHPRPAPLLATLLLLAGALSPARAANVDVTISGFTFSPSTVTIHPGDTVTWHNPTSSFHTVSTDDGSFGSGDPAGNWTYSHTFNSEGSFPYFCELHRSLGMVGLVVVDSGGGGGGDHPGTLRFESVTAAVQEGKTATLKVDRVGGDDGAVAVSYAVTGGTATAGTDFTAASGTLSWAAHDSAPKSLSVVTRQDATVESNETVLVSLSSPTGGATLDSGAKTTTLTIQDDDSGGSGVPTAPSSLVAEPHSTTEIMLSWTDSAGETSYHVERKALGGAFQEVATVPAGTTFTVIGGLQPATFYTFRVRAQNGSGFSGYSNESGEATFATLTHCEPSATALCLNNGRFQVTAHWRTSKDSGEGQAVPLASAPDSGLFYFFSASSLEMLVKVLNACSDPFNHYWVFAAATTNVEVTLTVIDTQSQRTKVYFNPLGTVAVPIQDTHAFATCP